jgi:hypothetical protein
MTVIHGRAAASSYLRKSVFIVPAAASVVSVESRQARSTGTQGNSAVQIRGMDVIDCLRQVRVKFAA